MAPGQNAAALRWRWVRPRSTLIAGCLLFALASTGAPAPAAAQAPSSGVTDADAGGGAGAARRILRSGDLRGAIAAATRALDTAVVDGDPPGEARALIVLSDAHLLTRWLARAGELAERAVLAARRSGNPALVLAARHQQANVWASDDRGESALDAFEAVITGAEQLPDAQLVALAVSNRTRLLTDAGRWGEACRQLLYAVDAARALPGSSLRLELLLGLGELARRHRSRTGQSAPAGRSASPLQAKSSRECGTTANRAEAGMEQLAFTLLQEAHVLARQLGDDRSGSDARGRLAHLYLDAGRSAEALVLLDAASFLAVSAGAPELAARWHWLAGRAHRALADSERSLERFRLAVAALDGIQPALVFGQRGDPGAFTEATRAIYLDLAEALLARAADADGAGLAQAALGEAREVMESFKAVELKNYFRDDCVVAQQALNRDRPLEALLGPRSAVVYPIVFAERTVLLFSAEGGAIRQFSVPVTRRRLGQAARDLRDAMRPDVNPRQLLKNARRLYGWLIAPLEVELARAAIDTLVLVPDGPLRLVPVAALHDGKDFLVRRFAFAVSAGLRLTPAPPARGSRDDLPAVLLAGLSESVQGFEALDHVGEEVARMQQVVNGQTLLDRRFSSANLARALEGNEFAMMSLATHAVFDRDPRESFLLTYDGKLSLDEVDRLVRIGEFRRQPLDLLVLSACATASGDERAAMGLAGAAVKAGVRSVMASLWSVNDRSTAELVPTFFEHLVTGGHTRARALQLAQLALLDGAESRHPFYWAPFVLLGSWH